jgi:hypothetical protein
MTASIRSWCLSRGLGACGWSRRQSVGRVDRRRSRRQPWQLIRPSETPPAISRWRTQRPRAVGAPTPVKTATALLAVAGEQLVAGFAGDAELPADIRHALPVEEAGDEAETFFHDRTQFPPHPHPAERRKALPMCPERDVTYVSGRSHPLEDERLRDMGRTRGPHRADATRISYTAYDV